MLSSDSERERALTSEESDILQRSNKKFKPDENGVGKEVEMEVPSSQGVEGTGPSGKLRSYSQMAQGFDRAVNPLFESNGVADVSDDEENQEGYAEDMNCPTIYLSKEDKRRIRHPWMNAIIIKLFDRRMSYEVLVRKLKLKWNLKGQIALTDVGHAYYVVRFSSLEDYEFVLTQGPWLIGDSYLTIRKWIPNFIADEEPIKFLTAWVRIPHLSVEYFDKQILHKIGEKIGKVIKIDRNTESMDRGQYVRFCIEVDISKPLLSKFRLNGRIWKIQYEGLKMVCFKCGRLGHKEDKCGTWDQELAAPVVNMGVPPRLDQVAPPKQVRPEVSSSYGDWMLVQKNGRRTPVKNTKNGDKAGTGGNVKQDKNFARGLREDLPGNQKSGERPLLNGSRFEVLSQASQHHQGGSGVEKSMEVEVQPAVASDSDLGNPVGRAIDLSPVDNSAMEIISSEETVAENQEKFLEKIAPIFLGNKIAVGGKEISISPHCDVEIISESNIIVENKNLKDIPKDSEELRIGPIGQIKKLPVKGPKLKKSSLRKSPYQKPSGKENIGPSVKIKSQFRSIHQSEQPIFDRVLKDGAYHTGIPNSPLGGDVCGGAARWAINGSGSPLGQPSEVGSKLLSSAGQQCTLSDGNVCVAVHYSGSNESSQGGVPLNDA